MKIAVLLTVHNRKEKTLACLKSLEQSYLMSGSSILFTVYLTDDGCTDGTTEAIAQTTYPFRIHLLKGNGKLYWNGGMIHSWKAALQSEEQYDGYLWLNDDTRVLPDFWKDICQADHQSIRLYGKKGIYVGSTCDPQTKKFTYGGFCFTNKWTLKDRFVTPDGQTFQPCECAHGNITYVSKEVVNRCGIFYEGYIHGAGDHDYTYLAHKAGFPILVMPHFAGECENDHKEDGYAEFMKMPLKKRLEYLNSPFGFNLHNTVLFQKRCFPYRAPFVKFAGYVKALFPQLYMTLYRTARR